MSKSGDIIEIAFTDYATSKLSVKDRAMLLVDIFWAVEIDYFHTDTFDGDAYNEDIRLAIKLIKKRDNE